MSNYLGIPNNNPTKYLGANVPIISIVRRNREPTGADLRDGATGAHYPIGSEWIVSKNPTTGVEGDKWYLSKIASNIAFWIQYDGGIADISSINVDASTSPGTDPVLPTSSAITLTGGQVASSTIGANVIRTNSLAASTATIQIQQAGEAGAEDTTLNGVCHFDSTHFNVNGGFVSLSGGGLAVDSLLPDTGTSPILPNASGQISITGQTPANISGIQTTGGTNSLAVSMFSPFEGDFSFSQSNSASATNRKLVVTNADTTSANSNAQLVASVGGTSSGDAHNIWSIASTRSYSLGPDTSDSSILKLTTAAAASVTPSTGTVLATMSSTGSLTLPLQPCMEAFLTTSVPNATGNSVVADVIMDTELFNQNPGSFVAGVYTVPSTGKYLISWNCGINDLALANTEVLPLIAINGVNTSAGTTLSAGAVMNFANDLRVSHTDFFSLTAGQTVSFRVRVTGGTQIVGIEGSDVTAGVRSTYACIKMIC